MINGFIQRIGWLRAFVLVLSLLSLPCAFITEVRTPPWDILILHVMPGFALLMIWSIPFDILLARIFMSDKPEAERTAYRTAIKADLVTWLALLLVWGVFFTALLRDRLA